MTLPAKYPQANQTAQPRPHLAGGATFDHVEKLCLHTTETAGWPGYPTFAPHLTYNPWTHVWHQHYALTKSATTLADPSSTKLRENRDFVIQVEIVAYCDPKLAARYGHFIDDIDDEAVRDLAELAAWLHGHGDLELKLAPTWLPYPASGRADSRARMSSSQFDAFHGIHGHEHASGNLHGDPGAPPWLDRMLAHAKTAAGQLSTTLTPTGKALDMADATDVYVNFKSAQALKPGDNEIKINEDGGTTLVIAPNDGVDIAAVVDVRNAAGDRVPVEVNFRVRSYKDKTPTTTLSARVPEAGGNSAFYKGSLSADPTTGRSARLRLFVKVPDGVTDAVLKQVQVTGWKL